MMTAYSFSSATFVPVWAWPGTDGMGASESLASKLLLAFKRTVTIDASARPVAVEADTPAWVIPTVQRLAELQLLPYDWDSYGGLPLQPKHLGAAIQFLNAVMGNEVTSPDIVPLSDGGIQLEWRSGEHEIDFISEDDSVSPTLLVTSGAGTTPIPGPEAVGYFREHLAALVAGAAEAV
jgi:hypothetical protein